LWFASTLALISLATVASSATAPHPSSAPASNLAFDRLKSLAGSWKGTANMMHGTGSDSAPVDVRLRVTLGGDALLHEMTPHGRADDPTNGADDPVTMFYLDRGQLVLTHYCDSGHNRPRMV